LIFKRGRKGSVYIFNGIFVEVNMDKVINKIEVHVGVISFYKGKCLVLKRTDDRRLYPGLWECGGGKVHMGENFEDAVIRQMQEEAKVVVEIKGILKTYSIDIPNEEQKVIPGLKFVANIKKFLNGSSPEISDEHLEFRFIDRKEIDGLDFIPGVEVDVKEAFDLIKGKDKK
jgi:8-oxo-dGTP diphosphatase